MSARNGYFQLMISSEGTSLKLFPPVDGGMPIDINEIKAYLTPRGYTPDVVELNKVLSSLDKVTEVPISVKGGYQESENFSLRLSDDGMEAIARFYPCSNAGEAYTLEAIVNDIKHRGVDCGIDEAVISNYLSDKHYCTDYVVAKGTPAKPGQDGKVVYHFNTDINTRPTLKEDGTADFHNLNTICRVSAGQLLAELVPAIPGEAGCTVLGEDIPAKEVHNAVLDYSNNIDISEDKLKIFSRVDGHASLVGTKVFVSEIYVVANVDTSTGNVDYNGNVVVEGNVTAGFYIHAKGNVDVKGVVEGAEIVASGNITIGRGMNGMSKGVLKAGGNVISKFLENATVACGGYVYAEAILHSKINARGDVEVEGKRGMITGGMVRSLGTVSARVIGSTMGANTEVEVGVDPTVKNRLLELQKKVAENSKTVAQIGPVLATLTKKIKSGAALTEEQKMYFKQLSAQYAELNPQIDKDMDELEALEKSMAAMVVTSCVRVADFAYPGTTIKISDAYQTLTKVTQHCRFVKDGADIRVIGF